MFDSEAQDRAKGQRERILDMLRAGGSDGQTNVALNDVSIQFGARLSELYALGYKIDVIHVKDSLYRYVLVQEPVVETKPEKALDLLVRVINENHGGVVTSEQLRKILDKHKLMLRRKHGALHRMA